jgi:hypothetical protein
MLPLIMPQHAHLALLCLIKNETTFMTANVLVSPSAKDENE